MRVSDARRHAPLCSVLLTFDAQEYLADPDVLPPMRQVVELAWAARSDKSVSPVTLTPATYELGGGDFRWDMYTSLASKL